MYDEPHLGHARTALVFDTLRRFLVWTGTDVTFVSNVTDVEDKIIQRAAETGATEPDLARRYEAIYWEQLGSLNVDRPDEVPHASAVVPEIVDFIEELVQAGAAYLIEGVGVYFAVEAYDDYGALSHRTTADLLEGAGARVDIDAQKRSPLDFALWKSAKPGEPAWPSPWGEGRPGWHIECSAMSLGLLSDGFDLHGGGDDLVFPHHENERAQAEAAGRRFARHWMHSGMVVVEGEKMSKSLGNFTTLGEVLDSYDPRTLRLLVLQTHYRKPMEMGRAEMDAAAAGLARLDALFRRARVAGIDQSEVEPDPEIVSSFRAAMDDDLNTPGAIGVVFDAVRRANQAIDAEDDDTARRALVTVTHLLDVLGLSAAGEAADGAESPGDERIAAMVAARDEARSAKDFAEADRIRDELTSLGVTLEDTAHGTVWHR
ncbi:MAG: cysteine--tRNA ligase [Acidimicrobiia bacterium]|nr:cysteine--tRNA ligase [Acidimicrobiia bacterium]